MTKCNLLFVCLLLPLFGCSRSPEPVSGGTSGTLVAGDIPLPEFEVRVFEVIGPSLLGFGTTNNNGQFRLVTAEGDGPLWLTAGEYAITLESIGPVAPQLPANYTSATKTPLKVKWKPEDQTLELKIRALK